PRSPPGCSRVHGDGRALREGLLHPSGHRPGGGELTTVDGVDGLDVARAARAEGLLGGLEAREGQGLLEDLDPRVPRELDGQLTGDAGEASAVERWCAQHPVDDDEDVAAGTLAQLAAGVGEDRLGPAPF